MVPAVPVIGQAHVAPRAEPVRREPVDAVLCPRTPGAEQGQGARVLHVGVRGTGDVPDRATRRPATDSGIAGDGEELVDLVRPDVHEDATAPCRVPEPRGPLVGVDRVRRGPGNVHHLPDGTADGELAMARVTARFSNRSLNSTVHGRPWQPAIAARTDSSCPRVVTPGLSLEHRLARLQGGDRHGGALARDPGDDHQVDVDVVEHVPRGSRRSESACQLS